MTRDEAREHLEAGRLLYVHVWTFSATCMNCTEEDGCCYDTFENVEEVLDNIERLSFDWDEVELLG